MYGPEDIESLRRQLKARRQLFTDKAHDAAVGVSRRAWSLDWMRRCQRIAGYAAVGGEISCAVIMRDCWVRGRAFYLPVLASSGMRFARCTPETILRENRYGILEPVAANRELVAPSHLDLVLTPLVACDQRGTRLGMGGGFYDRTFSFLKARKNWRNPKLVGLAHDFQFVSSLPRRSWDIPLDAIITPTQTQVFKTP